MQNLFPEVLVTRTSVYLQQNWPPNDFLTRRSTELEPPEGRKELYGNALHDKVALSN
jgi:hypothetical protein